MIFGLPEKLDEELNIPVGEIIGEKPKGFLYLFKEKSDMTVKTFSSSTVSVLRASTCG